MKKNMKKLITLLTATSMSMSMMTGCNLFKPTADSLIESCAKKMAEVETMDLDITMDFGMNMIQGDTEVSIDFDILLDMLYEKKSEDEYQSKTDMEMKIEMLGAKQSMTAEGYTIGNGDTVTTYTKTKDADEWVKKVSEKEESDFMDFNFEDMIGQFTLAEETVTENGKECYVLEGDVVYDNMSSLLENMDMGEIAEEDTKVHMVMNIDKKEKLPVSITMEVDEEYLEDMFDKEDLSALGDVSIEVDKFEIGLIYDEIGGDITVEVPEEVLDAEEAEDDNSDAFNLFGTDSSDDVDDSDESSDGLFGDDTEDDEDDISDESLEDDAEEDEDEEDVSLEDEDYEIEIKEDSISMEEFESEGYECKEYVSEDDIYLLITNNNSATKDIDVYAYFKKGDDIVDRYYNETTMESGSTQVVDFYSSKDYDSIMYTFIEKDTEGTNLVGDDLVIKYDIDEDGNITGTITNDSDETISYAQAHFVLMNDNNEVIEHKYTYTEEDIMKPGETQNFDTYIASTDYESIEVYGIARIDE